MDLDKFFSFFNTNPEVGYSKKDLEGFKDKLDKFCNPLGENIGEIEEEMVPYPELHNKINVIKSNGYFIIGYAGTIGKANSLEIIFNLAEKFQINQKKVYFLFIGEGPMLEYYSIKYKHLKNIMFNKFISKNILPNYLSQCDILINSWSDSKLYEYGISPNKWNEYMFSERPFLLLHNYESKIFKEANCGWQIKTNDLELIYNKILEIKLLSNDELRVIGMNGKNYLLNSLSYSHLTNKFEKVLKYFKIEKNT
jgi:hypothetical protein